MGTRKEVAGIRLTSAKTVDYTYDSLNRLTLASSSNVTSGSNYRHSFTYGATGNILSGPAGIYSYSAASSSYANPHALTSLTLGTSTTNYAYDNNGNLTSSGLSTYSWNYRNYLTQTGSSSYAYDSMGQRVRLTEGTSTTIYPTQGYNATGATSTKNVFANGILVATVTGSTSTAQIRYTLVDHLGSTNVITDESGNVIETLDYYAYGGIRVDVKASGFSGESRKYIGQEYDEGTSLSYLNARYYDAARGQFVSQDPVFLAIGDPIRVQQLTRMNQGMVLSNPQALNSYSYAGNNPITYKDPDGKFFGVDDAAGFALGGVIGSVGYVGVGLFTGQNLTWGGIGGAFVTGGILGVGAANTPETLGASNAIAVAIVVGTGAGAAGGLTQQGVDILNGTQKDKRINWGDVAKNGAFTGVTGGLTEGILPSARIPYLSSGRGNYNAVGQQILTKGTNGTISNISVGTGVKAAVGSQASNLYQTLAGTLADLGRALTGLLNSISTSNSGNSSKR